MGMENHRAQARAIPGCQLNDADTPAGPFREGKKTAGVTTRYVVIYAGCSRMKDEGNNWVSAGAFAADDSKVMTSHGICPQCIRRLYPGLDGSSGPIRKAKE